MARGLVARFPGGEMTGNLFTHNEKFERQVHVHGKRHAHKKDDRLLFF